MSTTVAAPIPHPGLEGVVNTEELKRQCPAFASGCPYAKLQVDGHGANLGDLSKCPAFQQGCPFSNKDKDEVLSLFSQIPSEHPPIDIREISTQPEGAILAQLLNQFLTGAQLEIFFPDMKDTTQHQIHTATREEKAVEAELLKDPQLAAAMREGTMAAHKAAENSVFTKRFLKGEINKDEYGRYINSLYFVYKSMEELLDKHQDHPAIKPIYFPHELKRVDALLRDLEYYYGKDRVAELTNPSTMTPAVKEYVEAMEFACTVNPGLLVAHSYSRYLGDLSGGQILAKRLKKHVLKISEDDASWDSDEGLAFYRFTNIGNQNEFKSIYRERLNDAPVDRKTRDLIVAEAIRSFELNIGVFDEIQKLSQEHKLVPANDSKAAPVSSSSSSAAALTRWSAVIVAISAVAVGATLYYRARKP